MYMFRGKFIEKISCFMHIRSYHASCLATSTSAAQQTTVEHHRALTFAAGMSATDAYHLVAAATVGRATLAAFAATKIESQTMLRFAG